MKELKPSILALAALVLLALTPAPVGAQQQEFLAYPERWYVKQERLRPDDWVVEFSLPGEAQVRQVFCTSLGREQVLFDRSDVSFRQGPGGRKLVVVTVGGLARYRTQYKGSLEEWARTLRVRYVLFRPRGPQPGPRQP